MRVHRKRSKIKLTTAPTTETPAESQATTRQVDVDRQMFLQVRLLKASVCVLRCADPVRQGVTRPRQALVVRIMKTRKVLTHTLLYEAILRESRTRFAPSIPVIKKCIEGGRQPSRRWCPIALFLTLRFCDVSQT